MKTIRIAFSNMWGPASDFTVEYFLKMFPYLAPHYHFVIDEGAPEFVFYSVYDYVQKWSVKNVKGVEALKREQNETGSTVQRFNGSTAHDPIRIVYAGEPGDHFLQGGKMAPEHNEPGFYDYGLTMAIENRHPNHIYMPLMCLHLNLYNGGIKDLVRDGTNGTDGTNAASHASRITHHDYFCNFIYSNPNSRRRVGFFHKLSRYKRVESPGHVERNSIELGHGYAAKQAFQARCKFSIAFENTYFPGYTSEKLSDPLLARSVPIYSGNPQVHRIFNTESFINVDDFKSEEAAIEWIEAVDRDDSLYRQYLEAPPFVGNVVPVEFSDATYLAFFQRIFG